MRSPEWFLLELFCNEINYTFAIMATVKKKKAAAKSEVTETRGRKSGYDEGIANFICEQISTSRVGLSKMHETINGFPAVSVIMRWLADNEDFRERYARARIAQADLFFGEIIDIADTPLIGKTKKKGFNSFGEYEEETEGDMTQHRKLQIEARKWTVSKLNPKKYGDKVDVTTGGDKIQGTTIVWGDKTIQI